jgi:hypothetical protein
MDPGADLGKINGQYRSSWIVEPANGQIPFIKAGDTRGLNNLHRKKSMRTVTATTPKIAACRSGASGSAAAQARC